MDMNNAFDEILKIQDKLDKTNAVNPKITVDGEEYTLYHEGNKPNASDVGAFPIGGNTSDNPIMGNAYFANNHGILLKDTNGNNRRAAWMTDTNTMYFGDSSTQTNFQSSGTPSIKIGGTMYSMYHEGNKPSASDVGANTTLFSGVLKADGTIDTAYINKNNCMNSSGFFTVPESGAYLFIGRAWGTNSVSLIYNADNTICTDFVNMENLTTSTETIIDFSAIQNLPNVGKTLALRKKDKSKLSWAVFSIIKLN